MTFEEEFPSLKGEGLTVFDDNCLTRIDGVFLREDIQKFCLDKERVKQAIKNYSITTELFGKIETILYPEDLLKELGLGL